MTTSSNLRIGDRVRVPREKRPYVVRAFDQRFIIMTKPFNPKRTYQYTIVDLQRGIRGPDNLIFGPAVDYLKNAAEGLRQLQGGDVEVSHRRCVEIESEVITQLTATEGA